MSKPTLPSLPESLLARRPTQSGICPPNAILYMFLAGIPISFLLGIVSHYVGILVGILAGLLALLPNLLTSLCGVTVCIFALFAIIVILAAFAGYPLVVGMIGGEIVGWLGRKGHCRNAIIAGWGGAVNGLFIYAGHAFIAWIQYGGLHPMTVTTKMMGDIFSTTIRGTPWWMTALVAIEAVILIISAAIRGNGSIGESTYCETHSIWYGNWKQGRFSSEAAEAVASTLVTLDERTVETLKKLEDEVYPYLLVKTRGCPTSPSCEVEVSGIVHWQETTVNNKGEKNIENKSETWFDVMMPSSFGYAMEKTLNLQETLPALNKKVG